MTRGRIPTEEEILICINWESLKIRKIDGETFDYYFELHKHKVKELGLNPEITEAAAIDVVGNVVIAEANEFFQEVEDMTDEELDEFIELILEEDNDDDK